MLVWFSDASAYDDLDERVATLQSPGRYLR